MKFIKKHRNILLRIIDFGIILIAYFISETIISKDIKVTKEIIQNMIMAVIIYGGALNLSKIYKNITRYENGNDYLVYLLSCFISCIIMISLNVAFNNQLTMTRVTVISSLIISISVIGYRVLLRMLLTRVLNNKENIREENIKKKNVLVIGAGDAAKTLISTIKNTMKNVYDIVGLIDDDITKIDYCLSGNKIYGTRYDIPKVCKEKNVELILFTISNISNENRKEILEICQKTGCKVRILPGTKELIKNKSIMENFRNVEIEDLLGREQIKLDNRGIYKLIENRTVLVTRTEEDR